MLKNKQIAELKYISHSEPINKYSIGKDYLKETTFDMLDKSLEANELIKISLLKSVEKTTKEAAEELRVELNCEIVQVIGRTITLYRESKTKKTVSKRI